MASDLNKLIHELRLQIRSDINLSLNEQEERITSRINENIDQKFTQIQNKIEKINQTNEIQEKRISLLEKQIRARNLIFFGVEEGEKSYESLEEKILSAIGTMGVQCSKSELEIVMRIGLAHERKTRPIKVTFTTYGKKISILKNKNKLENIYIKEDFPPQVLEIRKSLQAQLEKERSEGKLAYLKYDRLIIKERNHTKQGKSSTHSSTRKENPKKRELESTPPQLEGNTSSQRYSRFNQTTMHQNAKKNKLTRGGKCSIEPFVQRRDTPLHPPSTASDDDIED